MAQRMASGPAVPLEAIGLAQPVAFDALLNVLERGVRTRTEVLEELPRLNTKWPNATEFEEWRRDGWYRSTGRWPR